MMLKHIKMYGHDKRNIQRIECYACHAHFFIIKRVLITSVKCVYI